MDIRLARRLIARNNAFYRDHAASFSATRAAPWQGWRTVARIVRDAQGKAGPEGDLSLLDVACGNLRFERFLVDCLPDTRLHITAIDSTPELAAGVLDARISYLARDVLARLLDGADPLSDTDPADLVVSFGFLHHVPGSELRRGLLGSLARRVAPGGLLALSFWQFMDDARLAAKAATADGAAREAGWPISALEDGDHFLGWQDDPGALRYCHHFPEAEIDELASHLADLGMREVARFSADGRSGALNRYLVCQRTPSASVQDSC